MLRLFRHFSVVILSFGVLFGTKAGAVTITIDVINASQIEISMSGTLTGPQTEFLNDGILFIAIPDLGKVSSTSISGDLSVGSNSITHSYIGYNNLASSDEIQLRSGLNGENNFSIGDVLSGTGILTFSAPHNLLQSMFDGIGAEVFWKGSPNIVQGYAVSPKPIPLPASAPLLLLGFGVLAGLGVRRRVLQRAATRPA